MSELKKKVDTKESRSAKKKPRKNATKKQLEARNRMKRAAKEYHAGKYKTMQEAMKKVD